MKQLSRLAVSALIAAALLMTGIPVITGALAQQSVGGVETPGAKQEALGRAWQYYNSGNYALAIEFFTLASEVTETKLAARLGLGYTYIKLGQKDKALFEFTALVEGEYKIAESLPMLVGLLVENKEFEAAERYIAKSADQKQAAILKKQVRDARDAEATATAAPVAGAIAPKDSPKEKDSRAALMRRILLTEGPAAALKRLEAERKKYKTSAAYVAELGVVEAEALGMALTGLKSDDRAALPLAERLVALQPDNDGARSMLSWVYFNAGRYEDALKGFSGLLDRHPGLAEYSLGAGHTLLKLTRLQEALAAARAGLAREGITPEDRAKLVELEVLVLWNIYATLKPESDEAVQTLEEILALRPEAEDALAALSWARLNRKEFGEAEKGFARLVARKPESADYSLGLCYALVALDRAEEALVAADRFADRPEFGAVLVSVRMKAARGLYERGRYREAAVHLRAALERDQSNEEARTLLGWSLYNSGQYGEALPLFLDKYNKSRSAEDALMVLRIYDKTDTSKAEEFMAELSADEALKRAVGDYYNEKGMPITAAQRAPVGGACYAGAADPSLDLYGRYTSKTGDAGLSKLAEVRAGATMHFPMSGGSEIVLKIEDVRLTSGNPEQDNLFMGNYYLGPSRTGDLITGVSFFEPSISYRQEGELSYEIGLGATGLGGGEKVVEGTRPTMHLSVSYRGAGVELHHEPMRESILSYTGLKDIYSDQDWGGVIKSGAKVGYGYDFGGGYNVFSEAGYDVYRGDNVVDNSSVSGTLGLGKSIAIPVGSVYISVAATAFGFAENVNHYTYGYGGYFSPQAFFAAGPSVKFMLMPCGNTYFEALLAGGYLSHRSEGSAQYPMDGVGAPSAEYEGDGYTGMDYRAEASVKQRITGHLSASLSGRYNKSSEYTEWAMMGGLTLSLGERGGVR